MQRLAFTMKIFPGYAEEYKRRHDDIWPQLVTLLKDSGIADYTIFLDKATNTLFATLTIDNLSKLEELPSNPVMQEWWAYMKDIMETHADNSPVSIPLQQVFYLP